MLDAALAGADEANRRWEECRALVDQLRIENTALRTALQQAHAQITALGGNPVGPGINQDDQQKRPDENSGVPMEQVNETGTAAS